MTIELPYSQGIATHRSGNSSDDLQGVDGQDNACPLVTLIIDFLLSSQISFSLLKSDHLIIRNKTNRQARTDKKHEAQATGTQCPAFPSEKESNTITAAFQGGGFSPFPPGSNCLFSSLTFSLSSSLLLALRKMVFDAAGGVAISAGEKVVPPKFEPTPTSK